MIYVWYYCTERANKMRLVSTKDKLVLFSWRNGRDSPSIESAFWVCDFSFFSLAKAAHETFTFVILCQNSSYEIPRESATERVRDSERERERREPARKAGSVRRHFPISSKPNPAQPPSKTSSAAVRRAYQQWFCFVPACVCVQCVCVSVLKYNTIC